MNNSTLEHISLYLITDDRRSLGRGVLEVVEAAVRGGVRMVQYRPSGVSDRECLRTARALRAITAPAGCILIISDRADIALASRADGIHIGANDIPIEDARALIGGGMLIGYSAHDPDEAAAVQAQGADFITYSPVFPTTSHSKPRPPVGPDSLARIIKEKGIAVPVFALGGIGLCDVAALRSSGISRVAVVTAITEQPDISAAAQEMLSELSKTHDAHST